MGMDLRVLVGVFVTLFGIAVGMAGGDVNSAELQDQLTNMESGEGVDGFMSLLDADFSQFSSEPVKDANNALSADLAVADDTDFKIDQRSTMALTVTPGTKIQVGDATLSAQSDDNATVILKGFKGETVVDRNLSVSGTVNAIAMPQVQMDYDRDKQVSVTEGRIKEVNLTKVEGITLELNDADGTIMTESLSISLESDRAVFNHFRGNLQIIERGSEYSYLLNGHVHTAELPQTTIGGD